MAPDDDGEADPDCAAEPDGEAVADSDDDPDGEGEPEFRDPPVLVGVGLVDGDGDGEGDGEGDGVGEGVGEGDAVLAGSTWHVMPVPELPVLEAVTGLSGLACAAPGQSVSTLTITELPVSKLSVVARTCAKRINMPRLRCSSRLRCVSSWDSEAAG